ncbi:unnamed protein product [Lactuca saligna]|uniref:RRM domain-containing protein n=1 Tax=Lactuca saligna TaxID=75948 RepID=A0AA35YRN7_LACSI|nr:unnamed protein product [Lactuca saligna]
MIKSMDFSKAVGSRATGMLSGSDTYHASNDATFFSSSLPVVPHDKCVKGNGLLEDMEDHGIGSLLPDEDELLSGMMDGLDLNLNPFPNHESDEIDLFGSGGGMELEMDPESESDNLNFNMSKVSLGDGIVSSNGMSQYMNGVGSGTVAGEHPYGEHPSRTLFVRNINSNVEDLELQMLFEQYGDIRTLYTACKHRGFVMISYYDIRAARTAMRALQNKPLRRRKLDIHYSIPKDNPSDKDVNQGTLVVFNLDPSVSCEDLLQIFGAYGEVKEIRETPHKRHHKFIEYYDVRAAEAALRSLNRSDIAGKRIKLEPSRPGGARRNLMLQLNQEFEQDDARSFRVQVGTSIASSPPGVWPQFGSPIERQSHIHSHSHSPVQNVSNSLPGLASILHPQVQPTRIALPPIVSFAARDDVVIWCFEFNRFRDRNVVCLPGQNGHFHHNHHGIHVGSAPSGMIPFGGGRYHHDFMSPSTYGGQMDRGFLNSHGSVNIMENSSSPSLSNMSMSSPPLFLGNGLNYSGIGAMNNHNNNVESMAMAMNVNVNGGGRNRNGNQMQMQMDNKKQFQLDLDKIKSGEDTRTTLMIKNIPNKYTSKMLLASIDEIHSGTYDFLYLPIDFKNKCNVGYAFINMLSPMHIIPFYQAFDGKKWEKFNSEKVASLAYARIQGKAALVTHFQNSSLMNEDKRCRPILFHSEDVDVDQDPLDPTPF